MTCSNSSIISSTSSIMTVSYWLDKSDLIVRVNAGWDRFAISNDGGDELLSSNVIGRCVFNFITGDQTRMYLAALLQHARFLDRSVKRSYRCDSPNMKRFMSMCVSPASDSLVKLDHTLIKCEPLEQPLVYLHEPDPQAQAIPRCSVCTSLMINGVWLLPEDAKILGLLTPDKPLPVTYRICPVCKRRQPGRHSEAVRTT